MIWGGRLEFKGIMLPDAGRYLCTAVNAAGRAEGVAEVIVNEEVQPYIRKEETAFMGSNIELDCPVTGSPLPSLDWTKDGAPLPDNARIVNNQLWLRNVRQENAGRYICTATSTTGVIRDFVILHVKAVPTLEVKIEPSKEIVHMGDMLDLRCKVSGDPYAQVQWSKVSQEGPLPENIRIRGNVLQISGVKSENGGVYRCTVESYAGTFNDDYVLAIQVTPTFSPDTVETRTAPIGSTVVMDCQINMEPPVAYTWSKQGGVMPPDAVIEDGVLTIPNVRGDDAGTFICTARNPAATVDIPTILAVTGVIPYFAQAPTSYMKMPTLPEAYLNFDVQLGFKPESNNGLFLYNGQEEGTGGDFISLGLVDGFVEFRFELGSGPVIVKSIEPVKMGMWHTVKIGRDRKDGTLKVDEQPEVTVSAPGRYLGLDLDAPLYIGGVPDMSQVARKTGQSKGFVGCISRLKIGNVAHDLMRDAEGEGITTCETCAVNPCLHGGVCQEALSSAGYKCLCPPGFSGQDCEKVGEACYPGVCGEGRCIHKPGGGFECYCPFGRSGLRCEKEVVILEPAFSDDAFVSYPTPRALRALKINMKVKPRKLDDGLLMYCAQSEDGQGDFASLAIRNQSLEFRFDTGSGPAILHSPEKLQADQWVSVVAERDLREGSLIVDDGVAVKGTSPGHTRGLNLRIPLYIGGVDQQKITVSPFAEVSHGFDGCVSHVEVNDVKLDLVEAVVDSANVEDCGGKTPCERSPCKNGLCRETGPGPQDYKCHCQEGFSGQHCEIQSDLCDLLDPCKNGGTCVSTGNTYRCNCPLGYSGSICEQVSIFDEAANFQGDGYLSLDRELLPHTSSAENEIIKITFLTTDSNGVLLFHGQKPETDGKGQDYLAVAVVDGFLEFSYELGSGPAQIKSPVKINDGKPHTVVLKRTGRYGSMELDEVHKQFGDSQGILQMLNTKGDIYIGGVPNHQLMTANKYPQGLVGCVWSLEIQNSRVLNLFRNSKTGVNVQPCPEADGSGDRFLEGFDSDNLIQK